MLAAGANLGPIPDWILRANASAPPITAGVHQTVYGSQGSTAISGVMQGAFGFGSGDFNLGRDAFND
jgi:hypothetical protein